MEFFTAILFACFVEKGMPQCYHTVWPKVLTSQEQCLTILSAGITAIENRGGKLIGYRCIDWTENYDQKEINLKLL